MKTLKSNSGGSLQRVVRRHRVTDFGSRLRQARQACEMTQAEVAKETGLQPSAVAHFECGRRTPTIHNLYKLCVSLGCPSDYLLALPPNDELTDAAPKTPESTATQSRHSVQ